MPLPRLALPLAKPRAVRDSHRDTTVVALPARKENLMTWNPVFIHLLHGRNDPEQDMTDWGYAGPVLGPFEAIHFTYKEHIRCIANARTGAELELGFHGDLLVHGGKFYGDFEICGGHDPE
jgi:hypothetical protein